jgi:hypothetical protein
MVPTGRLAQVEGAVKWDLPSRRKTFIIPKKEG